MYFFSILTIEKQIFVAILQRNGSEANKEQLKLLIAFSFSREIAQNIGLNKYH